MMETQFQSISSDIISGLVTGVTLAFFFFVVERIFYWIKHRKDVSRIRNIFLDARKDIMGYEDIHYENMSRSTKAYFLIACRYNVMVKELDEFFKTGNVHISRVKKKDIFNALDWYKIDYLNVVKLRAADSMCSEIQDGMIPSSYITIEIANEIFGKLESIKWLKMKPIAS